MMEEAILEEGMMVGASELQADLWNFSSNSNLAGYAATCAATSFDCHSSLAGKVLLLVLFIDFVLVLVGNADPVGIVLDLPFN